MNLNGRSSGPLTVMKLGQINASENIRKSLFSVIFAGLNVSRGYVFSVDGNKIVSETMHKL